MKIKILKEEVSNKIAAGEIIQNPCSIVRELLDNAIDSKASQINIEILEGGKKLISVKDNGEGMSKEDLLLSYKKHSTSKIENFQDIYKIKSMGFRGEALHSICSVSNLYISSKNKSSKLGHAIKINSTKLILEKKLARQEGTTVKSSDIFHNIPARYKSLKTDNQEWNKIKSLVLKKITPFKNISLSLSHNNKKIYSKLSPKNKKIFFENLLGEQVYSNILESKTTNENINIQAYISKPNYFKLNRKYQLFYINNRLIQSPALSSIITKAYQSICPKGEYPIALLFINSPPEDLDINIHPTKNEVQLKKEQKIYQLVYSLIKTVISTNITIPKIEINTIPKIEKYQDQKSNKLETKTISNNLIENKENLLAKEKTSKISSTQTSIANIKNYKLVDVIFNNYILIEKEKEIILIDQHAAHERMLYEEIQKKYKNENIPSEKLIIPIKIKNNIIAEISNKKLKKLNHLGFEIEILNHSRYIVYSIPYFVNINFIEDIVENLLELLKDDKTPSKIELLNEIIKMKSCKYAVKSGDKLTKKEIIKLIEKWLNYPNFFACPHGRPTSIKLKKEELEKFFLRKK